MADFRPEQAQAEVSSFKPGTIVDGRYRVLRLIGGGGNGLVHEVEHLRTGQRLALKSLLDPTMYQRLEQEARATSLLKSSRAVKIVDMGTSPTDGPYLVMELLAGQSLRELLHEAGQLPLEMTINIALQVGECLAEAHAAGIIHRDLKPDNIHLAPGPKPNLYDVKVLDFGIVKIGQDAPVPGGSLTRTGSTVGTPYYMSLEQLRNPSGVDGRSDLYALGVVLYECLSGRKPYDVDTIGDLVYALCSGPPTDLARLRPDLPLQVSRGVMRALAQERDDRYEAVIDLCRELRPFGDPSVAAWLDEPVRRPPPPRASSSGVFTGGAPTPSGVRPRQHSQATQAFPMPEGWNSGLPPLEPPPPPPAAAPSLTPPPRHEEASGRRDTPTTFYVRPEGGDKPDPDRAPDSAKTQMIDSGLMKSASGPSPYAPPASMISNPNPVVPARSNPFTKTAPLGTAVPDLPGLPPLPAPSPSSASRPGFGFAPPPGPSSGSGIFAAPPSQKTAAFPMMAPPPAPGSAPTTQPGFRPPSMIPQPNPVMTGSNMPMAPMPMNMTGSNLPMAPMPMNMTGSNLPRMNIPGTTGPLPMGSSMPPPAWMSTSYQGAPKPPQSGLAAFWNNAPPRTQIAMAAGAAAVLVLILLLLLWAIVR